MNKLNVKMLTLDIDGTLMNNAKEFPEINCQALQECERRGIRVALVSGRSFELMRQFAKALGIHPLMAACNGARIEAGEDGPTLAEFCFERAAAKRVYKTLKDSGMYFNSYRYGQCYMGNAHVKASLGSRYDHHVPGTVGDPGFLYETISDPDRHSGEGLDGVYKFVALGAPYDPRFQDLQDQLADMNLSVSSASRRNKEFMPTGVDKASAVRILCEKTGIPAAQVMAFGDQTNDIPMLQAAGIGVAMENGEDSVKAIADYIAPNNDIGGVGLFLREWVLDA